MAGARPRVQESFLCSASHGREAMATIEARAPLSLGEAVTITPYAPGGGFPHFVQPNDPALRDDPAAFLAWFRAHQGDFDALLAEAGALVFRGFPIEDGARFGEAIDHYDSPPFGYAGGSSPRRALAGRVYESTYTPPGQIIMLHQEMAYLPRWPSKIAFYCRIPPVSGGETFLADMRRVTAALRPDVVAAVEAKGVRYRRNFRDQAASTGDAWLDAIHRSWQAAFSTDDRDAAMAQCRTVGLAGEWLPDDSLDTVWPAPGMITHPRTGDRLWFNHFATKTICPESVGAERFALYDGHYGANGARPYDTSYGDGSAIPGDHIEELYRVLREQRVGFAWSHGDLLLVDNLITAHGRNSYAGLRDVQVALLG
jgi:hypothetical protein